METNVLNAWEQIFTKHKIQASVSNSSMDTLIFEFKYYEEMKWFCRVLKANYGSFLGFYPINGEHSFKTKRINPEAISFEISLIPRPYVKSLKKQKEEFREETVRLKNKLPVIIDVPTPKAIIEIPAWAQDHKPEEPKNSKLDLGIKNSDLSLEDQAYLKNGRQKRMITRENLHEEEINQSFNEKKVHLEIKTWEEYFSDLGFQIKVIPKITIDDRIGEKIIGNNIEFSSMQELRRFVNLSKVFSKKYNFCEIYNKPRLFTSWINPLPR